MNAPLPPVIDAHVHVLDAGHWPREWWDHVAQEWAKGAPDRRPDQVRPRIEGGLIDPDGSRMVQEMDAAGVDSAVVLPLEWGPDFHADAPWPEMNAHARRLAELHPGRIIPFFGIDPRRPGAAEAFAEQLESGSARGLKLYPSCGFDPADPAAMELFDLCRTHQVPVLAHTGDPLTLLDRELSHPMRLRPVVEQFPDLMLWLGHAGAPDWWDEALDVASASSSACLELSVWLWDDSTESDVDDLVVRIVEAKGRIGIERVMFGSDHVSGRRVRGAGFMAQMVRWYRTMPERARRLGLDLTEQDLAWILGGSAASMLSRRLA